MAVQHFTECVTPPHKFKKRSFAWMVLQASLVAGPLTAFAIATGHYWCVGIALEIGLMVFEIAYCQNWLFERLICLGGDRDVIGMVIHIDPPRGISFSTNTFDLDNDYSFNLLLQCTDFGVKESDQALADSPYGELIKNQNAIIALGSEVPQYENNGYLIPDDPPNSATLHCEFEGSGVHDMYLFSQAMLGIGTAAFAICVIIPHAFSWIVLLIFSVLVLLGFLVSKVAHPGSPSDVNSHLPTLHTNHEDSEGNRTGADVLLVQGTWVFDPLHSGYNEIHPIKMCFKIGRWNGDWTNTNCHPEQGPTEYDRNCLPGGSGVILRVRKALEEARADVTIANQKLPEQQWHFHPLIDACAPDVIL